MVKSKAYLRDACIPKHVRSYLVKLIPPRLNESVTRIYLSMYLVKHIPHRLNRFVR